MREQALPICNNALKELKLYFGNFEVISIEEKLMENIDEFQSYGRKFKGFIDLVTYFALLKRTAKKNNVEIFRVTSGEKKTNNCLSLLEKSVINIEKGMKIKNRLSCKYCKFYKTEYCK